MIMEAQANLVKPGGRKSFCLPMLYGQAYSVTLFGAWLLKGRRRLAACLQLKKRVTGMMALERPPPVGGLPATQKTSYRHDGS